MKKVLIIGGVSGGATCAARLRRLDEEAEIIILERGEYISYANCGLPYYIGDVIKSRDALLLQTPETMKKKYNIDVRVQNQVKAINRDSKTLTVTDLANNRTYEESYDTLVISTGSSPLRPSIPGIESPRIQTLWTVPDTDRIRRMADRDGVQSAVVVGGGFIGLEMAENLYRAGLKVSLVEVMDQVMAPLDYEMAQLLHENITQNNIGLHLGDGVESFEDDGRQVTVKLQSGNTIEAELVVLSIGVRPNSKLAKDAGLELNSQGGIIVDSTLRTDDPDIYAIGDVIEVEDFIFKDKTMIPLAGPANKQGRIAANNIAGMSTNSITEIAVNNKTETAETYDGTQGTSIAKVFDLTAASTGASEKALIKHGLKKGQDYESVVINQNSHAGYYPGAVPMTLKLLFSGDGKKIFGAQIVGSDGVDKRIDVISTAIRLGAGIEDLKRLELAYAPPYSSAKDPVNMAGFVAENVINKKVVFSSWDAVENNPEAILLDVREDAELMALELPGALHIPLGELRDRLGELRKRLEIQQVNSETQQVDLKMQQNRIKTPYPHREIITFCAIGVRSYNAARILMENGFENVRLYPGGTRFYQSTHYFGNDGEMSLPVNGFDDSGEINNNTASEYKNADSDGSNTATVAMRLDCSGMQCPGPIMKVFETMKGMQVGDVMEVSASDPGFMRDIESWCRRTGNLLLSREHRAKDYVALIKKGEAPLQNALCSNTTGGEAPLQKTPCSNAFRGEAPLHEAGIGACPSREHGAGRYSLQEDNQGKTIIVFSGDLDKVLASFIIANGAAAMGRSVTMFFTFWGLTALRKKQKQPVKKSFMEAVFGTMLPRGSKKLKLSKMNMGGMGTAMMKKIMNDKNVDSLETLIAGAVKAGVKIVACTMSMDVMGIKEEELIDGVELGGVGAYLGDAEESNVNLFI